MDQDQVVGVILLIVLVWGGLSLFIEWMQDATCAVIGLLILAVPVLVFIFGIILAVSMILGKA